MVTYTVYITLSKNEFYDLCRRPDKKYSDYSTESNTECQIIWGEQAAISEPNKGNLFVIV